MALHKRSKEHVNIQKKVKQQDRYECEICGITDTSAHGHHVIQYKDNGPADLINMMTLCPDCHRKYHSGKIKVDIWRF
jgi:5-methylcytosine-specific restriction endonuclease McrA